MRKIQIISTFLSALILSAPIQSNAAQPEREWTFLIFLNGHNNLDSYGEKDINEMEKVGSTEKMNVVVQWASLKNSNTKRMLVQKDNKPNQVTSPAIQSLAPVDMGDYKSLIEFVSWAKQEFPAKHYFINVWNHGGGWHRSSNLVIRPSDVSWDDLTGNVITTEQLGIATSEIAALLGKKIDIFGSDSCLMAMAEVAAQIAGNADLFIASEETEPANGWDYNTFLTAVNALTTPTAVEISKALVSTYVASTDEATLSAVDLNKIDGLYKSLSSLASNLASLNAVDAKTVTTVAQDTLSFAYDDYKDLSDLLNNLENSGINSLDKTAISSVRSAIKNMVIANEATGSLSKAGGISIWLPTDGYQFDEYTNRYSQLAFNKNTNWITAVNNFIGK